MAVHQKKNIIKVHPKIAKVMIAFGVIGFVSLIFISRHQVSEYSITTYDTAIKPMLITGDLAGGRGGIGYKKNHFIITSVIFIGNKSKYRK